MTVKTAVSHGHHETISWRSQFLRDVVNGLDQSHKRLPCKYFYDEIGSALFDEICELDEYYLTRTELAILQAKASEMADAIGKNCEFIEFGSGSGLKTRLVLKELCSPRAYVPIDIAREHLLRSARELSRCFPGLRVIPVHGDFTARFSLPEHGDPRARRVVYFPGSTIGNFSPTAAVCLLRKIAALVGSGGGLLIGFDLDKDESIVLPAYNDARGTSALFNLNLLARINRELDADFELSAFNHRALYLRSQERMVMHLVSKKDQVVRVAGRPFEFREGETIHTEDSYKYSLKHFARLTSQAGFTLSQQWTDPKQYFAVQYLTVDRSESQPSGDEESLGQVEQSLDGQGEHSGRDGAFREDHAHVVKADAGEDRLPKSAGAN
jgi:dimethylhistidine N-methyltransferase